MSDIVESLKSSARVLHRKVQGGDSHAISRMRVLRELKVLADDEVSGGVKRRHCLGVVARDLGFDGWPHAVRVLTGASSEDFGTLLCPSSTFAHWNIWSADYAEARRIRQEHGGYLLAYKKQFLIVDEHYIRTLGLDPEDPDWSAIDRDGVRPKDLRARRRLYGKLVGAALRH